MPQRGHDLLADHTSFLITRANDVLSDACHHRVMVVSAGFTLPATSQGSAAVLALLVPGVVCTGATLVLFYALIARTGPARAALAFYLSPAFAVALGAGSWMSGSA